MKYLSIYENEWECKQFLLQNGFISPEEAEDEEYDLLRHFEGDPDWVDILQPRDYYQRVFFAVYHPDYTYEGEPVCMTTAEDSDETEAVRSFVTDSVKWNRYEPNRWEKYEKDQVHQYKAAFRGSMGYSYTLSYA